MSPDLLQLPSDLRGSDQDSVLWGSGRRDRDILGQIPSRCTLLRNHLFLTICFDLKAAGTMSMYCPLRREIMESALNRDKEETAVTMKVGLYCVTHVPLNQYYLTSEV